jgi:DNA-binding CsgD family transcriptional regulator
MPRPDNDHRIRLRDVRRIFRLLAEVRRLGDEPNDWRPFMVAELLKLFRAEVVISSELYVEPTATAGTWLVTDIGWGVDATGHTWRIESEDRESDPKVYEIVVGHAPKPGEEAARAEIKPSRPIYAGGTFVLSSQTLPHINAIDQLGLHRGGDAPRFTPADHRLIRLFHAELGRFWRADVLHRTRDPNRVLAPRLRQTLDLLVDGLSEKEIANELSISPHTVHNYVKALHQRFKVSSRGELIAAAGLRQKQFVPRLSKDMPE